MSQHERAPHLIQSVSRALRILDEISATSDGLTAKELARICGLTLPTTYHLLRTLACEGYVIRRPQGSYVLGLKIAGHFQHLLDVMGRPPEVHDVLRHFAGTTGHSAYYGQVVDGRVVFTDLFEGPRSPHVEDLSLGFAEAAHATALGKALLSTMPHPERQRYLREQGLRPFTRNTVVDLDQCDQELRMASGGLKLFVDLEEFRDDVCCAAVVIPGERPAAIAVTSGLERWKQTSSLLARELRLRAGDLAARPVAG
ncbi:MAG TPA: helix-turn-helix domain-containing protein [Acidimicrobiia bacterium]|nr:helix-turn-helix domain-containing protein [Acidimicrobiia bacterium]